MKKLIITAAIVCAAAFANAAQLNWTAYGALNDGEGADDWYTGGQAYLIMVTDIANFAVANDLTITGGSIVHQADIIEGMAGGAIDGSEVGEGLSAGVTYNFAILFTTDGAAASLPTTGLYGINDNDGALYSIAWDKDTGGAFENLDTMAFVTTQVGGGEVIPEPSSALLLLLGMAGIALRRKQA